MPGRVLIINAGSSVDLVRATQIVSQFEKDREKYGWKPGRRNFVLYGREDPAAVWFNARQITVRFQEK